MAWQEVLHREALYSRWVHFPVNNIYTIHLYTYDNPFLIIHILSGFQSGMFSPGSHAPPPYPGQGQPSHLQPTTPMFVAPPPKTQRLLHSEAYLKYIEGLNAESSTVSKWDETLKGKGSLTIKQKNVRLFKIILPPQQLKGVMLTSPESRRAGCHLTGWKAKELTRRWQMHCGACATWCWGTLWTSVRHTTCNLLD